MRVQVGVICSLKNDISIPIYKEVDEQEYLESQQYIQNELYKIMRDYVFDKFKVEDEKEVQKYMKPVER